MSPFGWMGLLTTNGAILVTLGSSNRTLLHHIICKENFDSDHLSLTLAYSTHQVILYSTCRLPSCTLQPGNSAILTFTLCSRAGHVKLRLQGLMMSAKGCSNTWLHVTFFTISSAWVFRESMSCGNTLPSSVPNMPHFSHGPFDLLHHEDGGSVLEQLALVLGQATPWLPPICPSIPTGDEYAFTC